MRTETVRFTARLSAMTVSAGALAVLLIASPARSIDIDATIEAQQRAHLEGLVVRHDVRHALDLPRDVARGSDETQTERG